MQELVHDFR